TGTMLTGVTGADPAFSSAPVLGANAATNGTLGLANGGVGGNTVTLASGATSAYTFTLPVDGGTNTYVLQTNGSGTTSWVNPLTAGNSNYLRLDGTNSMSAAMNLNSHLINNVTDPVAAQDAATKNYADGKMASKNIAIPV